VTAVRLGWIAYIIPFVFVLSPALLGQGSAFEIIEATVTALVGVWVGSCGLIGFVFGPQDNFNRLMLFLAGVFLLLPASAIDYGFAINGVGFVIGAVVVIKDWLKNRDTGSAEA